MTPPVILAFLQNQWFRNPDQARAVFEKHPERRNDLIRLYLFMGCLTGKRLEQIFGEELCYEIVWEECSSKVGGKSAASFPADLAHMRMAIEKHSPQVILTFGKIAGDALTQLQPELNGHIKIIRALHPAARYGAIASLTQAQKELKIILDSIPE
jgi:hypothetical protein